MPDTSPSRVRTALGRSAGWLIVGLSTLYALFALGMAITEMLALLGAAGPAKPRVAPPLFVLHALTGAVALAAGAVQIQLGRPRTPRRARLHRVAGRCYVAAAWITCVAGAATAAVFDVGVAGRVVFAVWSTLWFTATTIALRRIRTRRVREHRDWMVRSFALAFVFVTFDPVRQALEDAGLPRTVVYPVALAGCAIVNLAAVEAWIRRGRHRRSTQPQPAGDRPWPARHPADR